MRSYVMMMFLPMKPLKEKNDSKIMEDPDLRKQGQFNNPALPLSRNRITLPVLLPKLEDSYKTMRESTKRKGGKVKSWALPMIPVLDLKVQK